VQGTYFFRDADDNTTGIADGAPYTMELRVTDLWDVNFGIGFQATLWRDMKLYAGPYVCYAEAQVSPARHVRGSSWQRG